MAKLNNLLKRANRSPLFMRLLNYRMANKVPFNKPHGIKILEAGDQHITTYLPYKKANLNHIRGIHACALATLSEYTTGLALLRKLDSRKYRLIMKALRMEYYYQGKTGVTATCTLDDDWLQENVLDPLKEQEVVVVTMTIDLHDTKNNHLCSGFIDWQIKDWKKVRTRLK